MGVGRASKENWFARLNELIDSYSSIFVVNIDNVSSQQMHQIRQSLRGEATVLMGKNTMVRRALRQVISERPEFERLVPYVRGNVGFVFTSGDLKEVRDKVISTVWLLLLVLVPLRLWIFTCRPVTRVWNPVRRPSSRLLVCPPRLPVVRLKLCRTSGSSSRATVSVSPSRLC